MRAHLTRRVISSRWLPSSACNASAATPFTKFFDHHNVLSGSLVAPGPAAFVCPRRFVATAAVEKDKGEKQLPAYLDLMATTPVDPRVLDAMLPFLSGPRFGNPHSRSHPYGWDAEEATETAREQVAKLVNASSKEIFFTSGATESNNLAVKGACGFLEGKKKHIVTTQVEHKCILASCRTMENQGWDVTYLPVKEDGLIELDKLEAAIRDDTALVSVMWVNNEIGTTQDMKAIGEICKRKKVLLHTDAAQCAGKLPIDVDECNISLMSLSGHKLYGPKGVGALYVRRKPRVRLRAIIDGGGQERGMRSGTLPTPIIVGFGKAAEVARLEMDNDMRHVKRLYRRLHEGVVKGLPEVILNGSETSRYHGNLNLSFACVEGESLLMSLAKTLAISSGSACTSASLEPSYVLRAIGVDEELAHTSLRFGFGRFTTEKEVDDCVEAVVREVTRLRDMSPLWELHLEALESGGEKAKVQWS